MPTRPDGSGLTNAEQKIVRGFELAVEYRSPYYYSKMDREQREAVDRTYATARAKLVALIRQNRPTK